VIKKGLKPMKIISIVNQKGGVGKTTSVINIGAGLQLLGKKVLLLDADPQAHLTKSLGVTSKQIKGTTFELLKGESSLSEIIIDRDGLFLIPSTRELTSFEMEYSTQGKEFMLKENLKGIEKFDYIFIDCPPSLGHLTLASLLASNEVIIPLQTEYLALEGLSRLIETIKIVRSRLNKKLKTAGIVAVRYYKGRNLHNEVINNIRKHFKDKVFKTVIRENIKIPESQSYGKTIFEYAPNSHGAEDYLKLCKEYLKRGSL